MVALVAVAEQTVVAGDLAVLAGMLGALAGPAVGRRSGIAQCGGARPVRSLRIVDQLAQYSGASLCGLKEQQNVPSVGGRKRFGGEFLVLELELGLDRALERRLEASPSALRRETRAA